MFTYLIRVLLKVHVGVLVGVNQFKLELVDIQHGTDVQVTQRVVLGELDRVAWLVRLLHSASLQKLAAFETYVDSAPQLYSLPPTQLGRGTVFH